MRNTTPFGLKIVELKILNASLYAEVADTPQASENGLMFRDSLPDDRGMLFIFEQPKTASFWMRNTKIPLSIAYIDSAGKILEIESMKPLDETVVPSSLGPGGLCARGQPRLVRSTRDCSRRKNRRNTTKIG